MREVRVGLLTELDDPGCREFSIGDGDWPFAGFVVRRGDEVHAYQNYCMHVGHPLNWAPDKFLTKDRSAIICASHGALYDIDSGECFAGPCRGKSLRRAAVEVRDGVVYVTGPTSL
ncbi:MAG TPA: Rieske (2Fe-2S) protein [Woeseiaceae bacterium]|nr:Rieske (2Fe-2S) protein [Woeseiaceae bacterium]